MYVYAYNNIYINISTYIYIAFCGLELIYCVLCILYVQSMCAVLKSKLFTTEPSEMELRGRSLECLGHIAVSVGSVHFAPYLELGMQSAQQGIAMNDDDLKEYSYIFYANASKAMRQQFAPALPALIPHLIEAINETELIFGDDDEEDEDGHPIEHKHEEEEDDEDDDDDTIKINGREGYINTKKAAITALASIAQYVKEDFGPYLAESLKAMLADNGPLTSYHDIIRAEAFESLQHFVGVALASHGIRLPSKYATLALPEDVLVVVKACMRCCLEGIKEDTDKLIVAKAVESVSGILEIVGVVALTLQDELEENVIMGQKLLELVQLSLQQKLTCQGDVIEQHEGDEEAEDHDNLVMDDMTDLIGVLARVMGPAFVTHFDQLLPSLLRFASGNRIHSDRSMAIGCFAEVIAELGQSAEKYAPVLLPLIAQGLGDEMEGVRRNSAYCLATLVQSTGKALGPNFLDILQWLYPLCTRKANQQALDTGGADTDNALSAVAKMIIVAPELLPLNQVLPVLLSALPLRSDNSEGPSVYSSLIHLINTQHPAAVQNFPALLTCLGQVLLPESKDIEETKVMVVSCLKGLQASQAQGSILLATLASIPDHSIQHAITLALQS